MRTPAAKTKPRLARVTSAPAPIGGWVKNQNLAAPDKRKPQGAALLENWFPTATGARMRSGSQKYATIGDADPVTSLMVYSAGAVQKLFAANATDVFDITTVLDPDASPTADITGQSGGAWVAAQFATPGGTFLRAVNGADTPQVFDGSSWSTSPAITAVGLTASDLSHVWSYKQRLFFIEKDKLDAWYLPVDSVGGTAVALPLGGVFSQGGSLMFGATWSLDSGSGLSEQCVFVTTEGEVAVFQGTDPGDASAWSKVGVYKIGRPLGQKAMIRAGGDIVVATDIGFVPLSQAIQRDVAALAPGAVSFPIETAWNEEVAARPGTWECAIWPTQQMVLVAMPTPSGALDQMFIANARTGSWCVYTGWGGTCLAVFGDRCFFGTNDGRVIECEITGADDGAPYTASYVPLFDDLKSPASIKVGMMARAVVLAPQSPNERLSLQTDYAISMPTSPSAAPVGEEALWGTGVWGASTWGEERTQQIFENWQSVSGRGYALAPSIQITSGSTAPPLIDLVRIDLTFDTGDVVT